MNKQNKYTIEDPSSHQRCSAFTRQQKMCSNNKLVVETKSKQRATLCKSGQAFLLHASMLRHWLLCSDLTHSEITLNNLS